MTWDVQKTLQLRNKLIEKVSCEKDANQKAIIETDLDNINHILRLLNVKYFVSDYDKTLTDRESYEKLCNESLQFLGSEFFSLYNLSALSRKLPLYFWTPKVSQNEKIKLTEKFFSCNPRLLELFHTSFDNYLISYDSSIQPLPRIGGITFPIYSEKNSYIWIKPNSHIAVLTHELGHADICTQINQNEQILLNNYSVLSETYPTILELLFCDNLLQTNYRKVALNQINTFIINYHALLEIHADSLPCSDCTFDSYFIYNNNHKYSKRLFTEILSNVLACYFYNLYLENPKLGIQEIENFRKISLTKTDEEIVKYYNIDDIKQGNKDLLYKLLSRKKN